MKFRKSQAVFYSCLSFIAGVGLASFVLIDWKIIYGLMLLSVIILIFGRIKSLLMIIGLCSLFFGLGISRYQLSIPVITERQIAFYNEQKVIFEGVISDEPDARTDQIKYKIKARFIVKDGSRQKVGGLVLVNAPLYPQYQFNDILEINCQLAAPLPIEDFKYDKYLAKQNIYSVCYRGQLKLTGHYSGNIITSAILKIKTKVVWVSGQILPEPQAAFLGGLLWGAKKGMPQNVLDDFTNAGITHIIAVSGYNITIIAVALTSIFIGLGLSRQRAFGLIVLGIAFFVAITGFPASIIRAGVMGTIVLMSTTLGRAGKITNTLAITAVIMLLFNPQVLIYDAGFQLSFLATLGLVYFSPTMSKWLKRLPNPLNIRELLATTLSAIAFTSPLILWQFGRLSVIAPLANLLVLPSIPMLMLLGFIAVTLGLIWLPLGQLVAWPVWLGLSYILNIASALASFSWSNLEI